MNIQLIAEQIGRIHLTLETQDSFEVYGGTWLGAFEVTQTGTAQWTLTVREQEVAAAPLRDYKVYARQIATGREWEVLSGKILVSARTAAVPADKLAPVEYFVTVPVVDHDVDAVGSTIVQGIPGPQGPKGDKGDPGEGGVTEEERTLLLGAAQRDSANTFTASNTFTGSVDMSGAQVTPPSGWNVEGVTAEQVQAVVPMKWGENSVSLGEGATTEGANATAIGAGASAKKTEYWGSGTAVGRYSNASNGGCAFGENSKSGHYGVAVGGNVRVGYSGTVIGHNAYSAAESVSVGYSATTSNYGIAIGVMANASANYSIGIGNYSKVTKPTGLTIGSQFTETTDSGNVTHNCTTEGTGSITIGAGANTLNNGDTESSNSVTIGCKALNQGADSVVIGAQASNSQASSVVIGAAATDTTALGKSVAIGKNATTTGHQCGTAVGCDASASYYGAAIGYDSEALRIGTSVGSFSKAVNGATAVGSDARAEGEASMAIGMGNAVADKGVAAFLVSDSWNAATAYTKLYFVGANTPLATEYYNGEAFMGYTVTDANKNVLACGTRRLSELFPDNSLTQPASLDENGEWVMPKVFHPSDLDMPTEEPSEPEEYKPLPVWPIVEPEDLPPHAEVENS